MQDVQDLASICTILAGKLGTVDNSIRFEINLIVKRTLIGAEI